MEAWGITDTGLVRRENQDAYAIRCMEADGFTIAVVCDGMGGASGGKLASTLAVDTFLDRCLGGLRARMTAREIQRTAEAAIAAANTVVYRRSWEGELRGMGTTLVSAIAWGEQALICNVGDSRAYHARIDGAERGMRQITRDHSYVERLLEMGDITVEEARVHPNRNLITRALGPDADILSDSFLVDLAAEDRLLLCSDGVVETATNEEIEQVLLNSPDGEAVLNRLLELAKSRGAPDNVTAVLLRQR